MSSQSQSHKVWENVDRSDPNSVWKYFFKEKTSQLTKCKLCSKEIKCAGSSTSGMHTHIKTVHSDIITNKRKALNEIAVIKSPAKITKYFPLVEDNSLEACVSRMVALDGFPYVKFVTSIDLRNLFLAKAFKTDLPKSENSIRKVVVMTFFIILIYNSALFHIFL